MHQEAKNFTLFVKSLFPEFFAGKMVLDVGSGDINGNNRFLFDDRCSYIGNDVSAGRNVTIVSKTSALPFQDGTFDTICSTECFEHDPEWEQSLQKIVKMLKPGGLFFFTCASTGRGEHGTRRTTPENSFGSGVAVWQDHYRNMDTADLRRAIPLEETFSQFAAYYSTGNVNPGICDLYFWGVKRGGDRTEPYAVRDYTAGGTTRTA
jgi:SAM-dependent methyltransferase